jgi:hypothetical protein
MIATIIITLLAFAWLAYETDYFRVRLPVGKDIDLETDVNYNRYNQALIESKIKAVNDNPNPPITNPIIFTPLDFPEMQGTINVSFKRVS